MDNKGVTVSGLILAFARLFLAPRDWPTCEKRLRYEWRVYLQTAVAKLRSSRGGDARGVLDRECARGRGAGKFVYRAQEFIIVCV